MKVKVVEVVSPDYLENLFSSDQFIQTNLIAGKRTERAGHETAYKIYKPIGKDAYNFSKVFEGNSFSTEGFEDELEKHHKRIESSVNTYPLVSAHFHPNYQLVPSPSDLFNVSGNKIGASMFYGYDLNPIFMIGRKYDGIDLLVFQQKVPIIPEALFGQLLDDLYEYDFCNEYTERTPEYPYKVAEKMKESGLYKAAIIKINNNGKIDLCPEIKDFSFSANKCADTFEAISLAP